MQLYDIIMGLIVEGIAKNLSIGDKVTTYKDLPPSSRNSRMSNAPGKKRWSVLGQKVTTIKSIDHNSGEIKTTGGDSISKDLKSGNITNVERTPKTFSPAAGTPVKIVK